VQPLWRRGPHISKLPGQKPTPKLSLHYAQDSSHHKFDTSPTPTTNQLHSRSTTGGFSIDPEQNNRPAQGPPTKSPLSAFSLSSLSVKEEELDGNHLVLSASLVLDHNKIPVNALIDTGAFGYAFISEEFVSRHKIKTYTLKNPCQLDVIDRDAI
jgi:hypothetical protein